MKLIDTNISLELPEVLDYLKVNPQKQSLTKEAEKACQLAFSLVNPGVIYQRFEVKRNSSPTFFIGNVEFKNKALSHNLSDAKECLLYVITIGDDFSMKANDASDYLISYFLDTIGNLFLRKLREKLIEHLGVTGLSRMSPGSTNIWPLADSEKIFMLLGNEVAEIGVSLSESHLMIPLKTISGILFFKKEPFFDCFLCQDTDCQARQVGYDNNIAEFYNSL